MTYKKHIAQFPHHFTNRSSQGFTLAEIIVSTLLLSIFAVGSFKSFHYAQHLSNNTLSQFLVLNQENQKFIINELEKSFSLIHIDPEFPILKCLFERRLDQQSYCR